MSNHGYLDAAATSPLLPEARSAMIAVLEGDAANPSSVHAAGHRARSIVDHARQQIAEVFGVRPSEVIFTSGGTEANNLAIIGLALANPRGRHVVTTAIEHPSVIESCAYLERVHGFEVTQVPVDAHGLVDADQCERAMSSETSLVTVGLANGEVGTVQPVPNIARHCDAQGVIMHTDAVQAAATLPVSLAVDGWPGPHVSALSLASHKFGGPQGAGALIVRDGVALEPLMHGGGQEHGRRSGTENVAAIAGFAAAVTVHADRMGRRARALAASRDAFVAEVLARVPGTRYTGHPNERLPGHASFVVPGVSGESILVALDAAGIAASSGSACAAGKDEPSPVLLAMGISPEQAQTAIRFTLPEPLEPELSDRVVRTIAAEVQRALSVRDARQSR